MISETIKYYFQGLAAHILADDWFCLRRKLADEYKSYLSDNEWCPPLVMQELLISAEDHRFFKHPGFDIIAICRAIYRRAFFHVVEGASTIDQQVVRVLTGNYERTVRRKLKEILLATLVTSAIPKRDLPAIYIRIAYYGWRMNNYKDACRRLHLNSSNMSLSEAANLIARLKYPEPRQFSAIRSSQIKRRVRHLVALHNMHASTVIYSGLKVDVSNAAI